jgi:hypothetical protein
VSAVSGAFITAEERSDRYSAPQRGYLYFTLPAQDRELAQREWADLKSVAGDTPGSGAWIQLGREGACPEDG